jgi:Alcohol dehydrogenase GroES-like domain
LWSYRLVAPYTFERVDIPEKTPDCLGDRQVLLRFLAAGICGSDLPGFRGTKGRLPGDTGVSAAEMDGFPVHEIVGEVIASRHRSHGVGDRVVGWASGFDGLMERVVADGDGLAPFDPALTPQHAVALQPLACVLFALEQLPDLRGRHVAVIGQGSIGLRETWRDGAYAYLGMAVPEFPNFFMLYGPNTNVGSNSVIFMLEAQAHYIVRALKYMRRKRKSYVAVRPATMAEFIAGIDEWMQGTVWLTQCSNYFRAANGRVVTQWPRSARAFWGMTRRFRPADYTFDAVPARPAVESQARTAASR